MDEEKRDDLLSALEEAQEAWNEFQEKWGAVLHGLEHSGDPSLRHEYVRLDAYKVGVGYDEGMGISMDAYFKEVEDVIQDS